MNPKPFYRSRTLQTGFVVVVLTWLIQFMQQDGLLGVVISVAHLFGLNPSEAVVSAFITTISVLLVAVWRLVTKQPLSLS